jgi:hypothetical protein
VIENGGFVRVLHRSDFGLPMSQNGMDRPCSCP